jgi:hypothetical protein
VPEHDDLDGQITAVTTVEAEESAMAQSRRAMSRRESPSQRSRMTFLAPTGFRSLSPGVQAVRGRNAVMCGISQSATSYPRVTSAGRAHSHT